MTLPISRRECHGYKVPSTYTTNFLGDVYEKGLSLDPSTILDAHQEAIRLNARLPKFAKRPKSTPFFCTLYIYIYILILLNAKEKQ
jgi:hypothetical protein